VSACKQDEELLLEPIESLCVTGWVSVKDGLLVSFS
jgi:hypothetical protein